MLAAKFSNLRQQASQRILDVKNTVSKKWEEMQEAPDIVPDHWEAHKDENGNRFYIDTMNGEMYRMNKRQHKRIDTIEKISLVEQMSKSPASPINEQQSREPWQCPSCTLENPGQATHCGACDTERPPELEPKTPSNLKDPNAQHDPDDPLSPDSQSNGDVLVSGDPNDDDNNDIDGKEDNNIVNNTDDNDNNNNNLNNNNGSGSRPESASYNVENDEDEKNEELSNNDDFIPASAMNGGNTDNIINDPNRDSLMVPNGVGGNNNGNNSQKPSHSPTSTLDQINAAIDESLHSLGNAEIDELNPGEKSILLQFCDLTDSTPDAAVKYLQPNWNLESAISQYFDDHPNHPKSRQISQSFGADDINRLLADPDIAPDSDLIVQSGGDGLNGGNQKRGSVDMGQGDNNENNNQPLQHNRLTTEENIEVARLASLQQAEFDKESDQLRQENERLIIENDTLKSELQDAKEQIQQLQDKLDNSRRREDELSATNSNNLQNIEQFQKDWDRMQNTFGMIVNELRNTTNALRQGDQTQLDKMDQIIQQVENLRSPNDYFSKDDNENGEQKQSLHGRTQSRSYEIFHKQKSSDPTYDRQKPAHTRTEHSRGPSFTLNKDIFNTEDGDINDDENNPNNNSNINDPNNPRKSKNLSNGNNGNNNNNDSDDDGGMRRDSIAKSENDEDMIAVIAYYELGDNDEDDDDGIHSRDSSWFGDYGRLPASRRVSARTPQTVKDLFDDNSNNSQLSNINSNGIKQGINNNNNNNNNGSQQNANNYKQMKEYGHGKRSSAGRASHGVNIQPTIHETSEETGGDGLGASTVRELFDDPNKDSKNSDEVKSDFNASNLTPISTESQRPSRAARLGDVFNNVGGPNYEELEKTHLTPASVHSSLVGGLHGIIDASEEQKQRSRNDEEVEEELRNKIRQEIEEEFSIKEKELREQLREEIISEVKPGIVKESETRMEKEFNEKLKKELDVVRNELQNSFEYQLKTLRNEMKETETNHRAQVESLENTKLDLIRSTSEQMQVLRDIIRNYSRLAKSSDTNNGNVPQMFQMFFNK